MSKLKNNPITLFVTWVLTCIAIINLSAFIPAAMASSPVAVIVDGQAITRLDIQKKVAFLRLMGRQGDLQAIAQQEVVDDLLRQRAIARFQMTPSKEQLKLALNNFLEGNHMTEQNFSQILDHAGVPLQTFIEFLSLQMGWGSLLRARYEAENGPLTQEQAIDEILKLGIQKPTMSEYDLRRVTIVVPHGLKNQMLKTRTRDAENLRKQFNGCASLAKLRQQYLDVIVSPLPLTLTAQLNPNWAEAIKKTPAGAMTPFRQTSAGLEAIAVCKIRTVSDDTVAQIVLSQKQSNPTEEMKALEQLNKKFLQELHKNAHIIKK